MSSAKPRMCLYLTCAHKFNGANSVSQIMAIHFDKILVLVDSKAAISSRAIYPDILVTSTSCQISLHNEQVLSILSDRTVGIDGLTPKNWKILAIESA
ncbi:hypothetical protein Tco_0047567 [Tanacetum coccineum]